MKKVDKIIQSDIVDNLFELSLVMQENITSKYVKLKSDILIVNMDSIYPKKNIYPSLLWLDQLKYQYKTLFCFKNY